MSVVILRKTFTVFRFMTKMEKEWFKIAKDCWKVDTSSSQQIKVRYKYYAAELNAGSTYMDDQQLYVNG